MIFIIIVVVVAVVIFFANVDVFVKIVIAEQCS
jgi:hypothetical protein